MLFGPAFFLLIPVVFLMIPAIFVSKGTVPWDGARLVLFYLLFFYAFGIIPAAVTGFLTTRAIRRTGACHWLRSAKYGGFISMAPWTLIMVLTRMPVDKFVLVVAGAFGAGAAATAVCWLIATAPRRKLAEHVRDAA
jgi:hypothetical protein